MNSTVSEYPWLQFFFFFLQRRSPYILNLMNMCFPKYSTPVFYWVSTSTCWQQPMREDQGLSGVRLSGHFQSSPVGFAIAPSQPQRSPSVMLVTPLGKQNWEKEEMLDRQRSEGKNVKGTFLQLQDHRRRRKWCFSSPKTYRRQCVGARSM